MKIYTNENNTATLKLLIAANLAGKKIKLETATFEGSIIKIYYIFYKFTKKFSIFHTISCFIFSYSLS